jgi:fluoroacetyl-CoA thioesterase
MPAVTLVAGLSGQFRYRVGENRTVAALYPDAADFQLMPAVFATGFLVALCEWAAIALVKPHLDWPAEQTLGTHVNFSHTAPTPPGMTVTVDVTLIAIDGRKLTFDVNAHDGVDSICRGSHERHVILRHRFNAKVAKKAAVAGVL